MLFLSAPAAPAAALPVPVMAAEPFFLAVSMAAPFSVKSYHILSFPFLFCIKNQVANPAYCVI